MENWFKHRMEEIKSIIEESNLKEGKIVNLYSFLKTIWEDYQKDKKWEK